MVEVIAFRDVEGFAVSFLKAQFASRGLVSKVGTKLPGKHSSSDAFVRVSRSGGVARDLVTDSPTVLVECFGADTVSASNLATVARALLLASARLTDTVTRATDGGGVAFLPDPDTNQPKYQFLVQLDIRGTAI